MYRIVVLVCVFAGVQSSWDLNPGEICTRHDSACMTRVADRFFTAAIRGDPSHNIEILDPGHQPYIHGKFIGLDYKLFNTTVIDLKTCHVINTKLALEQHTVHFKLYCSHVYMYGKYEISGILIIVPIEGNGDYSLDTKDYYIHIETGTKTIIGKDGKEYLQFKNFNALGDLRGGMTLDLTNLFNGQNDQLADAALKFANDQWKPVAREFQGPPLNANIKKIMKNLNKYFRKVPLNQFVIL